MHNSFGVTRIMPIYEYQCESCDQIYEAMQSISAAPHEVCPECSGRLERIFSPPSLNLGHFVSGTAEKHTRRLTFEQQAKEEEDRLLKHAEKTGIKYSDLFEDHEHH